MSAMTERINALTLDIMRQQERWETHDAIKKRFPDPEGVTRWAPLWALLTDAIEARLKELLYELRALVYRRSL